MQTAPYHNQRKLLSFYSDNRSIKPLSASSTLQFVMTPSAFSCFWPVSTPPQDRSHENLFRKINSDKNFFRSCSPVRGSKRGEINSTLIKKKLHYQLSKRCDLNWMMCAGCRRLTEIYPIAVGEQQAFRMEWRAQSSYKVVDALVAWVRCGAIERVNDFIAFWLGFIGSSARSGPGPPLLRSV